jgi:predicted methyltransferase
MLDPVRRRRGWLAFLGLLGLAAGCTSRGATPQAPALPFDRVLAGDQRSPANRALDEARHPRETLLFFGIAPQMRVAEVWPGTGWYTEVIAPLLTPPGVYYAALPPPDPASRYASELRAAYLAKLASRPDLYAGVQVTTIGPAGGEIAPPGSLDLVVSFLNLHDFLAEGWAPQALGAMYRALKPQGVLGIVDHRGNPQVPQDPTARSGYVNEDYAVRLIEASGFELLERSEINANPRDRKDYAQGVWTLPPTYRLGAKDHEQYAAIGESDRFTLRFRKAIERK